MKYSQIGKLADVGAIEFHGEDVGDDAVFVEATPQNALAVG